MDSEGAYDRHIKSMRLEIQTIRLERKIAATNFQQLVQPWIQQQSTIRKKQTRVPGKLHLYVAQLETLHMLTSTNHIPQGVMFKEASLCLYLHTIEAYKRQMKMMTSSCRDMLDHLERYIHSINMELIADEIKMRNEVCTLQSEITDIEESFMKMNEARRATLDMSQHVPLLGCKEGNQTRVKNERYGDVEKGQLGGSSIISIRQFALHKRNIAPRAIIDDETFCPNGATAA